MRFIDFSRKFAHDALKNLNDSEVPASTVDGETSHDPHASHHRSTPDFESESDEETKAHVASPLADGHLAVPNLMLSPVSPIHILSHPHRYQSHHSIFQ